MSGLLPEAARFNVVASSSDARVELKGIAHIAELEERLDKTIRKRSDVKFLRFQTTNDLSQDHIIVWARVDLFDIPRTDDSAPDDMGVAVPLGIIAALREKIAAFIHLSNRSPVEIDTARCSLTMVSEMLM